MTLKGAKGRHIGMSEYATAKQISDQIKQVAQKYFDIVEEAGAIRREDPATKTITFIVAGGEPVSFKLGGTLFSQEYSPLAVTLYDLEEQGLVTLRPNVPFNESAQTRIGRLKVKFHVATHDNWVIQRFLHTAHPKKWSARLHTVAKAKGWVFMPTAGGFMDGSTFYPIRSEDDLWELTNLPRVLPKHSMGAPLWDYMESGIDSPVNRRLFRKFVDKCHWVDTKCGGQWHQYTLRCMCPSQMMFMWIAETAWKYGYDHTYLNVHYRYIDFEGYFYFTCGWEGRICSLINRKQLDRPERPWLLNPTEYTLKKDPLGRTINDRNYR